MTIETHEERTYPDELPLVPLREAVIFPRIVTPLGVGREKSVAAVNAAMGADKHYVILAAQRDAEIDDVQADQVYSVATVAEIVRLLKIPDGSAQVRDCKDVPASGLPACVIKQRPKGSFTEAK